MPSEQEQMEALLSGMSGEGGEQFNPNQEAFFNFLRENYKGDGAAAGPGGIQDLDAEMAGGDIDMDGVQIPYLGSYIALRRSALSSCALWWFSWRRWRSGSAVRVSARRTVSTVSAES